MTKNPVCCRADDMVTKAAQVMQSENIGSIPVIENERTQKLVGIVTDRDLVLKIIAKGHDVKSTKVEAAFSFTRTSNRARQLWALRWHWPQSPVVRTWSKARITRYSVFLQGIRKWIF